MTDVSVVIGFRDWGQLRIELALTSIQASFGRFNGETILSDFGSEDHEVNRRLAERLGVKYVYTPREENWSRSRALNAGFAVAEGTLLVSTDADMVFTPTSFERIVELSQGAPKTALFLQCRDLPQGMDDTWVNTHPDSWEEIERASRLRPRWGMGGMMAIPRSGFELIRGFDERLHTYGGEDLDFAQRAKRAGYKTFWIDDPLVRMYHMWHPPTIATVNQTEAGQKAVEYNRSIVYNDKTFVRNFTEWKYRRETERPIVTVAISTYNRADYLKQTIESVLNQTVQDFEIVIVDDGGFDHTKEVVDKFNDPRIRYFWQENQGISAARNLAAEHSRGLFTAVIDDDDLMHPKRLEWQLEHMDEGLVGNVGCFINFDDTDGSMQMFVGKNPTLERSIPNGTAPGHGTWMIRTDVIRKIKYSTELSSGVDNNFFLRMLRAGYKVGHTGKPHTLRRMHPGQVTNTDAGNQTRAAAESLNFLRWGYNGSERAKAEKIASQTPEWPVVGDKTEITNQSRVYLPDHLVKRNLIISGVLPNVDHWEGDANTAFFASSIATEVENDAEAPVEVLAKSVIANASYQDMADLRKNGIDFEVELATASRSTARFVEYVLPTIYSHFGDKAESIAFIPDPGSTLTHEYRIKVGSRNEVEEYLRNLPSRSGVFVIGDSIMDI